MFGVVLSHALQTKEVGLLGCVVVADELQAEFIYEHVEAVVVLVHGSHVPETRGKVKSTRRQNIHAKLCEKKLGANLPGVVHHKLWRGQLRELVPHTPVHSGRSPRVVVVAQEVDGIVVLPGNGTQSSPAPEFVPATFGQPFAEFLGVVLAAWHDGSHGQDSQFVLHLPAGGRARRSCKSGP